MTVWAGSKCLANSIERIKRSVEEPGLVMLMRKASIGLFTVMLAFALAFLERARLTAYLS